MARTESLMGAGTLYQEARPGQGGVAVKYQLQVTSSDETGQSEWQGFVRLAVGQVLPGTRSATPTGRAKYIMVLTDSENRQGIVQITQGFGQVGGFNNYSVTGSGL